MISRVTPWPMNATSSHGREDGKLPEIANSRRVLWWVMSHRYTGIRMRHLHMDQKTEKFRKLHANLTIKNGGREPCKISLKFLNYRHIMQILLSLSVSITTTSQQHTSCSSCAHKCHRKVRWFWGHGTNQTKKCIWGRNPTSKKNLGRFSSRFVLMREGEREILPK